MWTRIAIVCLTTAGVSFLLFVLSRYLHRYLRPSSNEEKREFVDLITKIVGGTVLLAGLFFTWWNLHITQESTMESLSNARESLMLSVEAQIADRYRHAISQLGDQRLQVRLGGIYALETVARDSAHYHWPIIEILTAYVRENAKLKDTPEQAQAGHEPAVDILAIMTVLGRRSPTYGRGENIRLYLAEVDLRSARIPDAGPHFEGAILWLSDLRGVVFSEAHLEESRLTGVRFQGANLENAHFDGAMLSQTQMQHTKLDGSTWQRAVVDHVDFTNASLAGARLEGIDLSTAQGLTWDQITEAHIDDKTKLPLALEKHRRR